MADSYGGPGWKRGRPKRADYISEAFQAGRFGYTETLRRLIADNTRKATEDELRAAYAKGVESREKGDK